MRLGGWRGRGARLLRLRGGDGGRLGGWLRLLLRKRRWERRARQQVSAFGAGQQERARCQEPEDGGERQVPPETRPAAPVTRMGLSWDKISSLLKESLTCIRK